MHCFAPAFLSLSSFDAMVSAQTGWVLVQGHEPSIPWTPGVGRHALRASAGHGLETGQLDISALVNRGMERLGSELRPSGPQQIERRRAAAVDGCSDTP
jgi:hypothetical protein